MKVRKADPLFFLIKDRLKSFDCRLTKVYTGGLFFINQSQLVDPDDLFGPVAGIQLPLNVANLRFDSTHAEFSLGEKSKCEVGETTFKN